MNILSPALISFWFKFFAVAFVFKFSLVILRRRSIDQRIKALLELPDDGKNRIIRLYSKMISVYKIYLWIIAFGFLLCLASFILLFLQPKRSP